VRFCASLTLEVRDSEVRLTLKERWPPLLVERAKASDLLFLCVITKRRRPHREEEVRSTQYKHRRPAGVLTNILTRA
jgi:hypothetical protein